MSNPIFKDLPPIERKQDGSLYCMTSAQHKQARSLLRRECCSYDDGNCLEQDDGDATPVPSAFPVRSAVSGSDMQFCPSLVHWKQRFLRTEIPNAALSADRLLYRSPTGRNTARTVPLKFTGGRKHIPTRLFEQAVNLSKEARQIEKMLDEIGTFNSSKKKAEALALLKKWFPQMENFSGQLKKYQVTIEDLLAENTKLEERAKASEKGKMSNTLERVKLESELNELQRVIDRPIAEALCVSVAELISGNPVSNSNVSANMMKSHFYVCPICGNVTS